MEGRLIVGRIRSCRLWALGLGVLLLGLAAPAAHAHRTSLARADVSASANRVIFALRLSAHDMAVALGIETDLKSPVPEAEFEARRAALVSYLARRLRVAGDGAACAPAVPAVDYANLPVMLAITAEFRCPVPATRLSIGYLLFFDIDAEHRAIGTLTTPSGAKELLFDRNLTSLDLELQAASPQPAWQQRFMRMLLLGIEHIVIGIDHVLFLMALLMVNVRFWNLVRVVTAFTVAHSLTLSLAWYGVIDLPARLVESLIAASIAYVALENLTGRGFERRWLVAFGLGLVHGLGFFGVLRQLELDRGDALVTLFAFNLGVELGQIVIVALFCGLLVWWTRHRWYRPATLAASAVILAVAGYWVVERAFLI